MTTNQTIVGVPRELLDAPATESQIPQYFVESCDKFEWTPEEALRFYAEGKHFDVVDGRTRILCTGAIASHALKGMGEGYAKMKGIEPSAQPQCEPVAWVVQCKTSGLLENAELGEKATNP